MNSKEENNKCIILNSLAFAGYRSFGKDIQKLEDLSKINILIGPNNYGKSNVLQIINNIYPKYNHGNAMSFDNEFDRPKHNYIDFTIGLKFDDTKIIKNITPDSRLIINKILAQIKKLKNTSDAWFYFGRTKKSLILDDTKKVFENLSDYEVGKLFREITERTGGGRKEHWEPEILNHLAPNFPSYQSVIIPAIRRVGELKSISNTLCGNDLIPRLAELQKPDLNNEYDVKKEQFKKINHFLKSVLNKNDAEIEIPTSQKAIHVKMNDKVLPLESLGTGIQQVIILATATTITNGKIICIEEPELHLHPIFQKKLIRYLDKYTNNQYFIATHSASLMDTPNAEIYQITMNHHQSEIKHVSSNQEKYNICSNLGYHPSDLLQTNCIIWVEGPSDRIYLNHWISIQNDNLIEGIHYSIMFYGGKLASHLSGLNNNDDIADNLISLRQLNRQAVIIIDSDKSNKDAKINDTKSRLSNEFDDKPGFSWITEGREIENYIPTVTLSEAIKKIHPTAELKKLSKFNNAMELKSSGTKKKYANKVKVAQYIVDNNPKLKINVYDLNEKLIKLIEFIKTANPSVEVNNFDKT